MYTSKVCFKTGLKCTRACEHCRSTSSLNKNKKTFLEHNVDDAEFVLLIWIMMSLKLFQSPFCNIIFFKKSFIRMIWFYEIGKMCTLYTYWLQCYRWAPVRNTIYDSCFKRGNCTSFFLWFVEINDNDNNNYMSAAIVSIMAFCVAQPNGWRCCHLLIDIHL
mgnify:CR=1 FL=1